MQLKLLLKDAKKKKDSGGYKRLKAPPIVLIKQRNSHRSSHGNCQKRSSIKHPKDFHISPKIKKMAEW
jgi:hypothetical protein